jgi:small subunit ribosomal protein S8
MVHTDPIADFLTRIRNAMKARHPSLELPSSKMKVQLAEILKREGYIASADVVPGKPQKRLRIGIKYLAPRKPLINEIKRVSRPGCRIYASVDEISRWKNPVTTTILSTPKGILTDREALEAKVGGEVILRIQ